MELGDPAILISGVFIGLIGVGLATFGRKTENFPAIFCGGLLCIYPYFIESVAVMWILFAAILTGLYAMCRWL